MNKLGEFSDQVIIICGGGGGSRFQHADFSLPPLPSSSKRRKSVPLRYSQLEALEFGLEPVEVSRCKEHRTWRG